MRTGHSHLTRGSIVNREYLSRENNKFKIKQSSGQTQPLRPDRVRSKGSRGRSKRSNVFEYFIVALEIVLCAQLGTPGPLDSELAIIGYG